MKTFIKKILERIGFIDSGRLIYNSIKSISPALLLKELKYRSSGLPDGYPYPPNKLIFLIIAVIWVSEYYESGKTIFKDLVKQLNKNNIDVNKFKNILDFGCGVGRLIRHFTIYSNVSLFGTDYNYELIDWASENLTFGEFSKNELEPPLYFENDKFDFVYARSVFTHLGEDLQKAWSKEIYRILKPGGIFYFTTHGLNTTGSLEESEVKKFNRNELVVENVSIEGDNKCATFESKEYVEQNLLYGFKLIDHIPGREDEHLKQDIYLVQKV